MTAETPAEGQRPTPLGPFSATVPGSNRSRKVPAPWIDCPKCAWRHYPSTSGGRWHIATRCVSCGTPLEVDELLTDEREDT